MVQGVRLAPQPGFEPGTHRLTADCSAVELLRKVGKMVAKGRLTVKAVYCGHSKREYYYHPRRSTNKITLPFALFIQI
jgi:hypothetical protein